MDNILLKKGLGCMRGVDKIQKHLPGYNTNTGRLRVFGVPVILFLFVTILFITEDRTWPVWLLDGEVVIGTLGFVLMYMFFRVRADFKEKYGPLAYSEAATRCLFPGLALIFAVIARIGYIPGPPIPHFWWYPALDVLGWLLIITGGLLWVRSVQVFGVDNLTMLYVYHPEEGRIVHHAIYDILRHPIYGAAQRVAIGLAFLNGTWFALTLSLILALGLWGWVRLVEEKELIERFGSDYAGYRQGVPAFWPRFRDLRGFVEFMVTGKTA
jgi:protein-S-isoprenylcysteine O-methyltransferase Ste14